MGKTKTKLMRDVSIVGTSTIGQFDFADPKWADFSMYEPWACAVHQAADDAGISTQRIEKISHSHFAYFATMGHICAPVNYLEEWAGLPGKPISQHRAGMRLRLHRPHRGRTGHRLRRV